MIAGGSRRLAKGTQRVTQDTVVTRGVLRALCASAAILSLCGCPDVPTAGCPQDCGRGFQCDIETRTCVEAPLPGFVRALPGRAVRLAGAGDLLWTVSLDPADGAIIVAELDGTRRDARILATPARAEGRRFAIDASQSVVAVAWLAASGLYELAWRNLPSDQSTWRFTTVLAPTGAAYAGTQDFDLAVSGERAIALAFRDRDRTMRALTADEPDGIWALELVDDAGVTDDGVECPDQLRLVRPAAGVGYDPDVAARGAQVYVAYYDADCGDLRLGRRGNQRWTISVVDAGDSTVETGPERGLTGRWPSIDFDAAGAVAVAYHDLSGGRLMFAMERDGVFESEVVDAGIEIDAFSRERKNIVGAFAKLLVDDVGAATITYFDATSANLQLARRDGVSGEWSRQTLVADGAVGFSADQVNLPAVGRFVVAERLNPATNGFQSELVLVEAAQ